MRLLKTWRGRRVLYSERYPRVCWPEHPMASKNGLIRIHRIIASEIIGRSLNKTEHVHHLDGDPMNWSKDNLVILTQPVHAKLHCEERTPPVIRICPACGKEVKVVPSKANIIAVSFCGKECRNTYTYQTNWPTEKTLAKMIWDRPAAIIAKELGVSGSALKKHCKIRGITTPPRGYWASRR